MKRKEFLIAIVVLLIAFGSLAILKNHGKATAEASLNRSSKSDSIQKYWYYYNLATQYRLKDKQDSAISAYLEAIKLNSSPEDPLYYLGIVYMKAGEYEKAKETWQKLTEMDPGSERSFNQLGNLYFCIEHKNYFHPEKAKIFYDRAFDLNREAVNPQVRLGEIALFMERMAEASVIFDKLTVMDHKNLEVSFLTGYLKWKSGNSADAEKNLANAFSLIKNTPKNPSIEENQDCDLFLDWINQNLPGYQKQDIRIACPVLYTKFNQYLLSIRRQNTP